MGITAKNAKDAKIVAWMQRSGIREFCGYGEETGEIFTTKDAKGTRVR